MALASPRSRAYGQGSVSIQRGRYVATYKSLVTDKPIRRSFPTDAEAQAHLNEWYALKTRAALTPAPPRPVVVVGAPAPSTFKELVSLWRAAMTGVVRDTTWRSYDPHLNGLKDYLGKVPVEQLSESHFSAYRTARRKGIGPGGESVKKLAHVTINAHLDRANAVFEWGIDSKPQLCKTNPVERLVKRGKKLKVEEFEPVVCDGETIERLIAAAAPAHRLEFALLGHLALRWGEALGMGVAHINLATGKVLVRQQVIENREFKPVRIEIPTYGGKTQHASRDLNASEPILAAAREAYDRLGGPNPFRLLHPTRTGTPYRESNWKRQVWLPALKRAGLEDSGLTPHSLRHSRLSIMASTGKVTAPDLCAFAGHKSVAFTLRKYGSHFSDSNIPASIYLGL